MELGIYTFVENAPDSLTGKRVDPVLRFRHLMEEIELADQVGLDVFGIGEHHRRDFIASAPAVVLAAAAARTKTIRLTSAVTVLSSDDPVRVFEEFATVDLISNGRAEIMAGRGSFIESFPLFGYDLKDYDVLFAEKLQLLLALRDNEKIVWSGEHRAALTGQGVYPRPVQNPLPVWIAVGGTPESVIRAGMLGLPLAVAIIGGMPEQFGPLVDLYRRAGTEGGHDPASLKVSINSHGYVADTMEKARADSFPPLADAMTRIGRERGWPPTTQQSLIAATELRGALFTGTPDQLVEKILFQYDIFHHDRFLIQFSVGALPHDGLLRAIELFGTKVAPVVRKEIAARKRGAAAPANV